MVYGIGGNSRRWWRAFPEALARRHRVITLDNRGVGRSDQPAEPWTMADMVADIEAVAAGEGLDTFHLLGCSLGSLIVRHFAAAHPNRLRSLSLLCPPNGIPATPQDMQLGIMWDRERPRVECERLSWAVVHPEAWAAAHEAELLADFDLAEAERTPARTFAFQMQAVAAAPDANAILADAPFPVLILHGTVDRLVPPDNARTLKEALPHAELRWLVGASHSFWQHQPEATAEAVNHFLVRAEAAVPVGA
jgi:pimeloyl-ACP methyl ester carboxylesterase